MQDKIKDMLRNNAKLIDVRTPQEFQGGSAANAINIPLNEFSQRYQECGESADPVILFCASGGRSQQAANFLTSNGYKNVFNAGSVFNVIDITR